MAKTEKQKITLNDINKVLKDINKYSSIASSSTYAVIDEYISTGNYILNALMSGSIFTGIPNTRIVELAGRTQTGKTYLCLNIAREAQNMGYDVIYYDTENAIDVSTLENYGIDKDKFNHQPVDTIENLVIYVKQLIQKLKEYQDEGSEFKFIIFIDSMGNLASEKEKNDALSGVNKVDMTKQKSIKSFFRLMTMELGLLKIPLVFTNHVYDTIGEYIPSTKLSGGTGVEFAPSIILELSKANLKEENDISSDYNKGEISDEVKVTGAVLTAKIKKSRSVKQRDEKIHLSFYKGMNRYFGLHNYVDYDLIGIGAGKLEPEIITEEVLDDDGNVVIYRGKPKTKTKETGVLKFIPDTTKDPKKYAVKHLGKTLDRKKIFNSTVFTKEILEKMDELIIKPKFKLPKIRYDQNGDAIEIIENVENIDDSLTESSASDIFNNIEI